MSEYTHRGIHPDADLLSAFAEGALPEHERLACVDHLAACSQCREIVYLVQADMAGDAAPVPAKPPAAVPFWKRWVLPATAVAAIAVAAVVVVSIPTIQRQKPSTAPASELMAKVEEAPRVDAMTVPAPQPAVAPAPAVKRVERSSPPPVEQMQLDSSSTLSAPPPSAPPPQPAPAQTSPARPSDAAALSGRGFAPMALAAPAAKTAPGELTGVTGKVTDSAGAAVARAQVNLTDAGKSKTFTSVTDNSGQYSVNGVPPGHYQLTIQSTGFKRSENEIELQPQQIAKADSVLSVGSVADSVEVTAEVAAVRTSTTARANAPAPPLPTNSGGRGGGGGGGGGRGGRGGAVIFASEVAGVAVTTDLPGKQPAVTTVTNGKTVLSVDSNGALLVSTNSGNTSKPVKGKWKGKVVRLVSPADAPGANGAVFQLSTDSGDIWFSRDGSHWNPPAKH